MCLAKTPTALLKQPLSTRSGGEGHHRTQGDPEQAVGREEPGTAAAVCQGGELVAQGEIIQYQRLSRARQGAKPPDGELEEEKHRRTM